MADASTRRELPDLLERAPSGCLEAVPSTWAALVVDEVAQLGELHDLAARGLLSDEELEGLKERIVSRRSALTWATSGAPSPLPPPVS